MSSKHFTGFAEWSRAQAIFPKNHIILPMAQKKKNFVESFHNDKSEPTMHELLSFEFSRKYLQERACFEKLQKDCKAKKCQKKKIIYKKKPTKPDPNLTVKKFKIKKFANIPSRVEHRRNICKQPEICFDEEEQIPQSFLQCSSPKVQEKNVIICPVDHTSRNCCFPVPISPTTCEPSDNVPINYCEPSSFVPMEHPALCTGA